MEYSLEHSPFNKNYNNMLTAAATWSIFSSVEGLLHVMKVALPYSATGWMNWQYIFRSVWEWQPHDVPANQGRNFVSF